MLCFDCGTSVPPKNSVGPDALGVAGPCFVARETSENLQMISQRRKRLAFAPAASDARFGDCVKRPSALALERRLRYDPSHAEVMPYGRAESWLPRLSATPYPPARRCVAWIRLPSVVTTRTHFRPNTASVKLNSFAGPNARCGKTKPNRLGLPAQRKQRPFPTAGANRQNRPEGDLQGRGDRRPERATKQSSRS
jgi:hypothetical protein